jgi:uncharacterized membrane protein YvbJ
MHVLPEEGPFGSKHIEKKTFHTHNKQTLVIKNGIFIFFIIIIIIIIILRISFMQGNYTSNPETNHVLREHCVATILMLLLLLLLLSSSSSSSYKPN